MGYKGKIVPGEFPGYGAIFMSNTGTKKECFQRKLLGLPLAQSNFVLHVKKGMILFLFEFEKRQLHGVFRATSNGEIDIEPNAFKSSGKSFPAQVRFTPVWKCTPLSEHEFKDAIRDNYFSWKKFNFGLSKDQVYKLITLFHSKRIQKNPIEGDARFGDNRKNIRDRIRFVEEEVDEVKEIDCQGYNCNTLMKERSHKDNREGLRRMSDASLQFMRDINNENEMQELNRITNLEKIKGEYFRDDNRVQDEYPVINGFDRGSEIMIDGGYFGHERVESEQHTPYEPRGTVVSDEDFGFGDVNSSLKSHIYQNNSDFIPIPQVSEQFQHPFNIGNTYECGITMHTPYNPEVPDFCHRPYDPEVPEFCHKPSYFTPRHVSSPVENPPLCYPNFKSETIPYHHSENKNSDVGTFRSKKHVRKVSVFDRLTKAPEVVIQGHERDEKDELDASVNKVMKMLEKIVSSPIKRSQKRQSSFKKKQEEEEDDDDDDYITPKKIVVDYELLPNIESIQYEEGDDESVIEETRVVDFKRRKKITNKKNLDDTESDLGMSSSKRRKLVRPVFVKKESNVSNDENTNTPLKVGSYLRKAVEKDGEIGNDGNCKVLEEEEAEEKLGVDDMSQVDSLKDENKMCGWIEG